MNRAVRRPSFPTHICATLPSMSYQMIEIRYGYTYVENQENLMIEPQRYKARQIRVHVKWDIFIQILFGS